MLTVLPIYSRLFKYYVDSGREKTNQNIIITFTLNNKLKVTDHQNNCPEFTFLVAMYLFKTQILQSNILQNSVPVRQISSEQRTGFT